jgi:hypothetical protein
VPLRLPAWSVPSLASTRLLSTPQARAAASLSRSRAEAPACMMWGCWRRTTAEPDVFMDLYTLSLRRCRWGSANTARTRVQSTLSSSAIIIETAVRAPCPISVWGTRMVTMPSLSMASQALISAPSGGAVQGLGWTVAASASGMQKPMIMPPPAAAETFRKWRRVMGTALTSARPCWPSARRRGGWLF